MFKESVENSKTIYFIRRYLKRYDSAENAVVNAFESSLFLKSKLTLYANCKRYYQTSSLAKVIEEIKDVKILANSNAARIIKNLFDRVTQNIRQSDKESSFLLRSMENAKKLYFEPFKQISGIMVVAIFANTFFVLILRREVTFYGWMLRFFLLIISFCGLKCTGSLRNTFENSTFFKLIKKSANEKR